MAKYAVTVCLPPQATADLSGALASALAPFGPDTDLDWDIGIFWDSWHIRGGSNGSGFWVRAGCEDDPRLIHDGLHDQGIEEDWSLPGLCGGGPRELLDLSERPAVGRALAVEAWELWHHLAEEHPPALSHHVIMRRLQPDPHRWVDNERVHAEYEAQPLVQAYRSAHPLGNRDPLRTSSQTQFYPGASDYDGLDAESFADRTVSQHLGGWDLLTLDGWWIEADGTAHHTPCGSACPHQPDAYNDARGNDSFTVGRHRYLDTLPADTLLIRIHGHC